MDIKLNKFQANEILDMIYHWTEEDLELLGEDYKDGYVLGAIDFLNILNIKEEDIKVFLNK